MKNKFLPSLQLTALIRSAGEPGCELDVLRRAADTGFYKAVETRVFEDSIGQGFSRVCQERGIFWMSWCSNVIYGEGLNLTCLDAAWRRYSLGRVLELMDRAAGHGAGAFALLSGVRPENDADLPDALGFAADSMCELARHAKQYSGLRLLIEPLDRDVHKRAAIGTAAEAAAVIRAARAENPQVYMVWDSAHMKLQEGDLSASLLDAGDTVGHIHLCDAVIDPAMPRHGDYHPMPGVAGGFLDSACMTKILRDAAQLELKLPGIPVAIEAKPEGDPWAAEATTRALLRAVLEN